MEREKLGREKWATKIGLLLAAAGNAIGIGNYLRFPNQVASNGGGTYIIPYIISLLLLGIPVMLIEWGLGRYGGTLGHGTAPGIFYSIKKSRISLYLGAISIASAFIITSYYTWLESWMLSYSLYSFLGLLPKPTPSDYLKPFEDFFKNEIIHRETKILGVDIVVPTIQFYLLYLLTFLLNFFILSRGISEGIERLAKIAMPLLFIFSIILFVRVFTLKSPIGLSLENALAFIWEPDFSRLQDMKIWVNAAGQIFFSLSLGGLFITYASYLRKDDDIVLQGLSSVSLNEFAEVIFGSSIALISGILFFGVEETRRIAEGGVFRIGLMSMPAIFSTLPYGNFFSTIWFLLLFFAALTSSVALATPFIAFLEDELRISKKNAVLIVSSIWFLFSQIPIFVKGGIDEMDFWAGTIGLVVFSLIEIIYFIWIFGEKNAYEEILRGAKVKVPKIVIYIAKYISPIFVLALLLFWLIQSFEELISKERLFLRIIVFGIFMGFFILTHITWKWKVKKK